MYESNDDDDETCPLTLPAGEWFSAVFGLYTGAKEHVQSGLHTYCSHGRGEPG